MRSKIFLVLLVASSTGISAYAQMECKDCDPVSVSCSQSCWYCDPPSLDGCPEYNVVQSTCGDRGLSNPGCIQDDCFPNWVVTATENRGTYGQSENSYTYVYPYSVHIDYACSHHRVDWVTETDTNECNQNSGYWTKNECIEYQDGWKGYRSWSEDCCDGFSDYGLDATYTCNHYHACF